MKTYIIWMRIMLGVAAFVWVYGAQAQLYVGTGGTVFISSGEQIYISGNLDLASGATLTHNATSDITVTGVASLGGTVEYTALGNQNILPYPHQSMNIGGSGNKILSSSVAIANVLQLGGTAKLITGTNLITLTGGSSLINGAAAFGNNATSWVVTGNGSNGAGNTGLGGLKISGIGSTGRTGAVLFPVGPSTTTYNPITLTNTGTNDDFSVAVNDQIVAGVPVLESVKNTWNITETTPGASNMAIGVQWNGADETVSFSRVFCGIVHSTGVAVDYHSLGIPALGSNPYTLTGAGFTSFSAFGVTSNTVVLPVSYFNAKANKKGAFILINWSQISDLPTRYYVIEKSNSGMDFRVVGQVNVSDYSPMETVHSWTDRSPYSNANIYRIRSVAADGTQAYSNIVKVDYPAATSYVRVFPNPIINGIASLELSNKQKGVYDIRILNMSGHLIYKTTMEHNGINGNYPLSLTDIIKKGMYQLIILEPGGAKTTLKLLADD